MISSGDVGTADAGKSNTLKRILSATVLILMLGIIFYLGMLASSILLVILGVLIIDEIDINFLRQRRSTTVYFLAQSLFVFAMLFLVFRGSVQTFFWQLPLVVNFLCVIYLFFAPWGWGLGWGANTSIYRGVLPLIVAAFVFIQLSSLAALLLCPSWQKLLFLLLVTVFSMDTGAWLIGKNFGRHKLCKKISPKKSVEGLIGGIFFALVCALMTIYFVLKEIVIHNNIIMIVIAILMIALISHLGDLFQSKLKRQFNLKDSSDLIPGHGGVYDRVDSLIFVSPFYYLFVKYLLINRL
ncbi:MAG: phosphatidate cytidylyltransferase [Oligoflexia bacterium]|nr:phosphatidate cytidylyltransferase [Oligoflexia bacterium]